jgi:hypothetical protein
MEGMGIDVRGLAEALLSGEYTTETAVYSMLRRRMIAAKVHEVMENLGRGPARVSASHTLFAGAREEIIVDRTPSVRRVPHLGGRRSRDGIVGVPLRRGSINNVVNPLVMPPPPTILRPRPFDTAQRRPKAGTLR